MVSISYTQIEQAEGELNHLIDVYLQNRGWHQSSRNAASLVLWQRTEQGSTIAVNSRVAVQIQRELDIDNQIVIGENWPKGS